MAVVRTVFFLFTLCNINTLFAQKLDKERYLLAGPGEEGFELVLKKGNKFEFTRYEHMVDDYGTGHYIQDGSRLILFYDSLERDNRPNYIVEKDDFKNYSDHSVYELTVLDELNEPMPKTFVAIMENGQGLFSIFCDDKGKAHFGIDGKKNGLEIRIAWIGYEVFTIPLKDLQLGSFKITAQMSPQDTFYIESGRKEYRILEQKGFDVKLQDIETGTEYIRKRKWKED